MSLLLPLTCAQGSHPCTTSSLTIFGAMAGNGEVANDRSEADSRQLSVLVTLLGAIDKTDFKDRGLFGLTV